MKVNRAILLFALCLAIFNCQATPSVQIVRFPLISPMVTADTTTGEFFFFVGVKNYSPQVMPSQFYLMVQAQFSNGPVCPGFATNYAQAVYTVPVLPPDGVWSVGPSKRVTDLTGLNNCSCKKGVCGGTMRFTISANPSLSPYPGPNTVLELVWDKSGDPSKYQLVDKSLSSS